VNSDSDSNANKCGDGNNEFLVSNGNDDNENVLVARPSV
jgi:hypothetical protein